MAYNNNQHQHQSWSVWRTTPKHAAPDVDQHPITPPMSSTIESRRPATVPSNPPYIPRVALPPIAQFDRQLSAMHPLTPPDDVGSSIASTSTILPPIQYPDPFVSSSKLKYQPSEPPHSQLQQPVCVWDSSPHTIDWLDFTRNRSAHFIAEKTCEMICYLWFANTPVAKRGRKEPSGGSLLQESTVVSGRSDGLVGSDDVNPYPSPNHSPPSPPRATAHISPSSPSRSPPSSLQLVASPSFVSFMQKLLETTQVSQSVIVLSLHYIHRLKEQNHLTPAQKGSEFRIAVSGLMMANKFLDDNTYTNKTWSEVSGIELEEINRMEREFLMGVDFNLYVDKQTYESWLNLLKGLVIAKERDSNARNSRDSHRRRDTRKVSTNARNRAAEYHRQANQHLSPIPQPHHQDSYMDTQSAQPRAYGTPTRLPPLSKAIPSPYYPRARSTSPTPRGSYSGRTSLMDSHIDGMSAHPPPQSQPYRQTPVPVMPTPQLRVDTSQSISNKRTAEAAFSPDSASFASLPSKRPSSMILQIPDSSFGTGMSASSHDSSSGPHSYSPLDSLSSFARMTLANGADGSPERKQPQQQHQQPARPVQLPSHQPSTLVAPYAYSVENQRRPSQPQELYFYTLASSPMDEPTRSRSRRERRADSQDMDMPVDASAVDDGMADEDDEEEEVNGQRLRTRKGKLMRWYLGAQPQNPGGYAYDYSNSHSTHRQHQGQGQSALPVERSSESTAAPSQYPTSESTNPNLPPLVHPVPRQYIGVVQSASTSPSGIYLRNAGYPGSAYPIRSNAESNQYQQPSQHYSTTTAPYYAASYHPSPVQSKAEHYAPSHRDIRQYSTTASGVRDSMSSLPHFHDNVWARPPAVVSAASRRQDEVVEEDRSDVGSEEYLDNEESMRSDVATAVPNGYYSSTASKLVSHSVVPTAPFANAGPAGVHVAFNDYPTYSHNHANYSYGYPSDYSSSYLSRQNSASNANAKGGYHSEQPAYSQQQSVSHGQSRYADEWNRGGHREY
ncbi:hypothetical protein FA15DRAFT_701100 [Coprinopsis marcescibilis]|uniref:Cyclin-like domain-containing protein n=1 Tax=Coprinopsis marcescibilis TaxID=230819 RepID=A0A5C3L6S8_COPMA|nr:hypothetical protein FA15DRAFT_701100 [Coprinopsis marcescibilis]